MTPLRPPACRFPPPPSPRGGLQAFRSPSAVCMGEGAGGRKGGRGDRDRGASSRESAAAAASTTAGSNDFATVASRVTLSSYHALVRASLRRALERGTWRSHACWLCAGVDGRGRPRSAGDICPALRPAAAKALEALAAAERREAATGRVDWAEFKAERERVVVVAPPLFGSEAALREHLSHVHGLPLDHTHHMVIGRLLRRCPKEALPAEPSAQMLDALLGVSVATGGGGGCAGLQWLTM